MGRQFGGQQGDCPVTEDISDRLLRLPFYVELNEADLSYIVESITSFR
jgi:dTDP-4-amino-4,6-dideoxygalactose transaminase